jgi:hypothetical protein
VAEQALMKPDGLEQTFGRRIFSLVEAQGGAVETTPSGVRTGRKQTHLELFSRGSWRRSQARREALEQSGRGRPHWSKTLTQPRGRHRCGVRPLALWLRWGEREHFTPERGQSARGLAHSTTPSRLRRRHALAARTGAFPRCTECAGACGSVFCLEKTSSLVDSFFSNRSWLRSPSGRSLPGRF